MRFPRRSYFFFGLPLHWDLPWGFNNFSRVPNHWDSFIRRKLLFSANNYELASFCLFDSNRGRNRTSRGWLIRAVEEVWVRCFEWIAKLRQRVLSPELRHFLVPVPVRKKFEFLPDCKFVVVRRFPFRHLQVRVQALLKRHVVSEFSSLVREVAILSKLVDVSKRFVFCPMLKLPARVNLTGSIKPVGIVVELFYWLCGVNLRLYWRVSFKRTLGNKPRSWVAVGSQTSRV